MVGYKPSNAKAALKTANKASGRSSRSTAMRNLPINDKTVECLVCGKLFPRGQLDLNRHVHAITLQHLASKYNRGEFTIHCSQCGLYLTKEEHMDLHRTYSACGRGSKPLQVLRMLEQNGEIYEPYPDSESDSEDEDEDMDEDAASEDQDDDQDQDQEEADTTEPTSSAVTNDEAADAAGDEEEACRTMECMICGKLFPRGPIDLARHQTAITLKHLIHPKASAAYPYGCKKCGLHFTTETHAAMHESMSTCNPDMIWPEGYSVTSGLRTVNKFSKSKPVEVKEVKKPLSRKKKTPPPPPEPEPQTAPLELLTNPNSVFVQHAVAGDMATRTKRAKVLIPDDRKAFFAVISLLMDPKKIDPAVKVTDDNYEQFIAEEHLPIVQKLKGILLYTCQ